MGMYSELVFATEVKGNDTIINILKYMTGQSEDLNFTIDKHTLFTSERWKFMLRCDSYYFPGQTHSEINYDGISHSYYLTVRCNLKDYSNEIRNFLNWLAPYMMSYGFLGYTRYEGNVNPVLIYKDHDGSLRLENVNNDKPNNND